jgi:uncharacterized membrane protein YbhN (UPF0104 family)
VKKTAAIFAKLTVTLALLYFAVSRINLDFIAERLQHLQAAWLVAAIATLGVQAVVAAERWRRILALCGVTLPLNQAVRYTFISLFFSQVLPSTIGGDAARIWFVARDGAGWAKAIYSVTVDRVAGVMVLALLVVVCLPESFSVIRDPVARGGLLLLGLGCVLAPALFVAIGRWQWPALHRIALLRHLIEAANLAYRILATPRTALGIGLLSLVVHGLLILTAWFVAKSIAAPLDLLHALLLIPPIMLTATVPVSIGGWGVRESAAVMAFTYSGLPPGDGLLVSTLLGVATFIAGLPGGLLWLAMERRDRSAPAVKFEDLAAR